jgi:DNA-binding response OmpR family regulator
MQKLHPNRETGMWWTWNSLGFNKMIGSESLVLVVEDDPAMLRFIRRTLEVNDLAVVVAEDGLSALRVFQTQRPDLVVLDIGIPKIDGFEVCRRMKECASATRDNAPVIIVTARDADEDIVRGFEVGAEDYLAKPFSGSVLVARVKALLRRTRPQAGVSSARIECGDLMIDLASRNVTLRGDAVHLTPTEYKLLALLGRFSGKVLVFQQIFSEVWGPDYAVDPQMLRTHISRLRKKIEPDCACPALIQTVPGVGYRLIGVTSAT